MARTAGVFDRDSSSSLAKLCHSQLEYFIVLLEDSCKCIQYSLLIVQVGSPHDCFDLLASAREQGLLTELDCYYRHGS